MIVGEMLNGITDSMNISLSKLWGIVKDRESGRAAVHEVVDISPGNLDSSLCTFSSVQFSCSAVSNSL